MGLKGYYLKSDDTNGNSYVNLISMYTSLEYSYDYSFNYNFYNDASFKLNGNINPIYKLNPPYDSIVNSNLIYKDAYYRIDKIKTYEDISYNVDISYIPLIDSSDCSFCNGTGLTLCSICNNTGTIKDLSNILRTEPFTDDLVNTYPSIYGDICYNDISYVDSSGIKYLNIYATYDCYNCNRNMICNNCNANNKDNSYNIVNNYTYNKNIKLEVWVNIYSNQDNSEIYNNEILQRLCFIKDISKNNVGNWEEYYNYIKSLIKEKLHNEIQNCELYKILDISSHLEDV